jgi:protein SCO1
VRRVIALAALGLVLAGSLTACRKATVAAPTDGQQIYGIDHAAYVPASTPLTRDDGGTYSLTSDTTKPLTLVFFGYTNCPDFCPIVMHTLASAVTRLSGSDKANLQVVFVTTDPRRDIPAVLKNWVTHYDPTFLGLTGSLTDIVKVADSVHIYVSNGTKLPTGGYDLTAHDTHITGIMGESHHATVTWPESVTSAQLAYDIHELIAHPDEGPGAA